MKKLHYRNIGFQDLQNEILLRLDEMNDYMEDRKTTLDLHRPFPASPVYLLKEFRDRLSDLLNGLPEEIDVYSFADIIGEPVTTINDFGEKRLSLRKDIRFPKVPSLKGSVVVIDYDHTGVRLYDKKFMMRRPSLVPADYSDKGAVTMVLADDLDSELVSNFVMNFPKNSKGYVCYNVVPDNFTEINSATL